MLLRLARLRFQVQSTGRSLFFWLWPGPLEAALRWARHVALACWRGASFFLALAACRRFLRPLPVSGLLIFVRMRDKRLGILGDFRPELRVFALCGARPFQHAPVGKGGDVSLLRWPALKSPCACLPTRRTFLERVEAFIIALVLLLFALPVVAARGACCVWRAVGRWTLAASAIARRAVVSFSIT